MNGKPKIGALDHAMRFLVSRPHSEKELRDKLASRGHLAVDIDTAIARLIELRYVNDEELCPRHAESRLQKAIVGPARMRVELARKGFGEALIEKTVDELYSGDQTVQAAAVRAARKKIRTFKPGLDGQSARRKLFDHLTRKGFDMETARKVALDEYDTLTESGHEPG
ncbi:MAG: recombination regulator RecX [Nitrospinota bacterium]|nr:recombination regulator RecX [Nitrospinota bacterium]